MILPTTELERLLALEWAGTEVESEGLEGWSEWKACPVCRVMVTLGTEAPGVFYWPHEKDCWLGARIKELS